MALFGGDKKAVTREELMEKPLPEHVAIIMDGNGRWAKKRGLPRTAGHKLGVETLKKIVNEAGELGIRYLTVYAFSTENWKRPAEEVNTLMDLMVEYIDKELTNLGEQGVRINAIGYLEKLPEKTYEKIKMAMENTKDNERLILNVALNYGGRDEIMHAVKQLALEVEQGNLSAEAINEEVIAKRLYTGNQPDPDLLIRTSGELRLSNFLIWQLAYTEIWVTDTLWPDFKPADLRQGIKEYQQRNRRFGGIR